MTTEQERKQRVKDDSKLLKYGISKGRAEALAEFKRLFKRCNKTHDCEIKDVECKCVNINIPDGNCYVVPIVWLKELIKSLVESK